MKQVLLRRAIKLNNERKRRSGWKKIVRGMAALVVFCTTYALILPAITMEQGSICGIEAHAHGKDCYGDRPLYDLSCTFTADEGVVVLHSHDKNCYAKDGTLRCPLPQRPAHTHDDSCYDEAPLLCQVTEGHTHSAECTTEKILVCEKEAGAVHTHDAACSREEKVLTCTQAETAAHTHDETCVTTGPVLICGQEEAEAHTHTESCTVTKKLVCALTESEGHTHDESCTGTEQVLICTQQEPAEHTHDESCGGKEQVLTCTLAAGDGHTHDESCTGTEQALVCTLEEGEGHTHDESCTGTEQTLICTLEESEEHSHGEGCYETREKTCSLAESQGHTHGEGCYEAREKTCPLAETEAHTHGETCYETREKVCPVTEAAHTHEESCYETRQKTCDLSETTAHSHGTGCYETQPAECPLEETPGHSHDESCYETREIPCALTEGQGHSHGDACYEMKFTGCDQPENQPHVHGDACYGVQTVKCPIPETEKHVHEEKCYGEKTLHCTQEEIQPHSHDENCHDAKGTMTCTLPVIREHIHADACLTATGETVNELICVKEIHEHEDLCYADETEPEQLEYLCGFSVHTHTEGCYGEDEKLLCSIPEHTHSAACVREDLDLTVGVETPEDWEEMFRELTLTGNWPEDLVTIAGTQVNYQESRRNVQLVGQSLKGYTRYGAKFDRPYEDWDGLFVRFCMEYAGIDRFPQHEELAKWIEELQKDKKFRKSGAYTPKAGDLVFYDLNAAAPEEGEPPEPDLTAVNHVGIVTELVPATKDTPMKIRTVEGDVKNRVCRVTVELTDVRILGYGEMAPGYTTELSHTGEDYTVTAVFGRDAKIPVGAELTVRELMPGTEEYETHYRQTLDAMLLELGALSDEELGVTFARFFDIGFRMAEAQIEPAAPVTVQIRYAEPIVQSAEQKGKAVHFAESGIELLRTDVSGAAAAEPVPAAETEPAATAEPAETEPAEEAALPQQVDTFTFIQNSFSVSGTVMANARAATVTVWLDGTCGGLMSYAGSPNQRTTLQNGFLPTTWASPTQYAYKLKGWYDVTNCVYYEPGAEVSVSPDTVFYADWEAASYDIGVETAANRDQIVPSLDTNEFITTDVFDYSVIFNARSLNPTVNITNYGNSHSETWNLVTNGNVRYDYRRDGTPVYATGEHAGKVLETLNFMFMDWDSDGRITRPYNLNSQNDSNDGITAGIVSGVREQSRTDLIDLLFNPGVTAVGKSHLGQGNYLFQYAEDPDHPYYGYYYYDSRLNATSYNQSGQRFYIYDYLEYTSDTIEAGAHQNGSADFMPMNSPYANVNGRDVRTIDYNGSHYVYDSKLNTAGSTEGNVNGNFHFGMKTNIHFYLPATAGTKDDNGNYLNRSTTGDDMVFEFWGDDDVWIYLDDMLLLDLGGIHAEQGGSIDFSTGVVRVGDTSYTFEAAEGPHNLTIYYLERGSARSNCAIFFNLAPRYGLDLTKEDYVTGERMKDVKFQVFSDAACTTLAKLWHSHESAKNNEPPVNEIDPVLYPELVKFTTGDDGVAHMWGFVAGKTYYIKEISTADGYPISNDLIRITLNNHGTDISELTLIRGEEGTEGFEVTSHMMDKEQHLISMTLTNKKIADELTDIRVEKEWDKSVSVQVPVEVYLMANGEREGQTVTLSSDNAWGHTWTDLPVEDAGGNPIRYTVDEEYLPGYEKQGITATELTEDKVSWIKVGALENGATFHLALDTGNALSAASGNFSAVSLLDAQSNTAAQWQAQAYKDGFRLKCGNGYYLAFNNADREFFLTNGESGNQIFYYDGNQLFVMADNTRYYVAAVYSGNLMYVTSGDPTYLYKKVVTAEGTTVYEISNTFIPEERQMPLKVEKKWAGDYKQLPESIVVYVKKNDVIVAQIELTAENGWQGSFDGLDQEVLAAGGYTLEEKIPFGFAPTYSGIEDVSIHQWNRVSQSAGLETGEVYVFVSGNWALADTGNGVFTATRYNGTPAINQQWKCVNSSGIPTLMNMETGYYMREIDQRLMTQQHPDGNCRVYLNGSKLRVYTDQNGNGWHLVVNNNGSLGVVWEHSNATAFTVYQQESRSEYLSTITNTYGTYVLPETGGQGTTLCYAFGGLLTLAAALMYVIQIGRRRQKGGR